MQSFWHIAEWLYNTFLFQLAGLIVGGQVIPSMIPVGSAAWNAKHLAHAEGDHHRQTQTRLDVQSSRRDAPREVSAGSRRVAGTDDEEQRRQRRAAEVGPCHHRE